MPFQMEHDLMVFNPSLRRPHKAPCLLNSRHTTRSEHFIELRNYALREHSVTCVTCLQQTGSRLSVEQVIHELVQKLKC